MRFLPESDNLQNTPALVDLGIDSLVAVDTRSWFMRELGVDVPVMKILGGASMTDLVDFVFENLPQELLSRWEPEADQTNGTASVGIDALEDTAPTDKALANHETEDMPNGKVDRQMDLSEVEEAIDEPNEKTDGHAHRRSGEFEGRLEGMSAANRHLDTVVGTKLGSGLNGVDESVLAQVEGGTGIIEKSDGVGVYVDEVNGVDGKAGGF
jgi:hypothetical protein